MFYGIRINDRWFKEYVYVDKENKDKYSDAKTGELVDIVLTDIPERFEFPTNVGETIDVLLQLDRMRDKLIEVVPL